MTSSSRSDASRSRFMTSSDDGRDAWLRRGVTPRSLSKPYTLQIQALKSLETRVVGWNRVVLSDGLVVDALPDVSHGHGRRSRRGRRARREPFGSRRRGKLESRAPLYGRVGGWERTRASRRSPRRVYLHVGPKRDHERDAMSSGERVVVQDDVDGASGNDAV